MKFEKDFNPGTGNSYNEYNIQHIENFNPNATTVTTTHYHYGEKRGGGNGRKKLDDAQKQAIQDDILEYVGRLTDCVKDEWKTKHAKLWDDILAIPEVDAAIYDKGRQKNTTFNRSLVGNIMGVLIGKVYDGNPTDLTRILEGRHTASIREEMGNSPSAEIEKAVLELLV